MVVCHAAKKTSMLSMYTTCIYWQPWQEKETQIFMHYSFPTGRVAHTLNMIIPDMWAGFFLLLPKRLTGFMIFVFQQLLCNATKS